MPSILLRNISNSILNNISLEIKKGEIFVLVGPSGAGKTTLLQAMAGLVPYEGTVSYGEKSLDNLPPYKRRIGYLFQELLLFPHLTVEKNLLIAMKQLNLSKAEKQRHAAELLNTVGISSLSKRYPEELSGGEKQRAALARALATSPEILLLDEPFSSLDFRIARYLRLEFKQIQKRLRISTLFVTHNIKEAQELADNIGVMENGHLVQTGKPEEIWLKRDHSFNSSFIEQPNIFPCSKSTKMGNGLIEIDCNGLRLFVPDEGKDIEKVAILPRDIYISPLPPPGPSINRFKGRVKNINENSGAGHILLDTDSRDIMVEMSMDRLETMNLSKGDEVYGIMKLRALHGI